MTKKINKLVNTLKIKFEPLIHISTGITYGVQIHVSNFEETGFDSKYTCFQEIYKEGLISDFYLLLWSKILDLYTQIKTPSLGLFYKLEPIFFINYEIYIDQFIKLLKKYKVQPNQIYIYIGNEHSNFYYEEPLVKATNFFKQLDFNIELDGFGNGFSTMKLLYSLDVSFVKIDRFYLHHISSDSKKRFFAKFLIRVCHQLGIKVVAPGIENKKDFLTCKDIGIDYIKGLFAQEAQEDPKKIKASYKHIHKIYETDKRLLEENKINEKYIQKIQSLHYKTKLFKVFEYFKQNAYLTLIPIIDEKEHLKGVIYEEDIKKLSYSKYGSDLAKNDSMNDKIMDFVQIAICVEKNWGIDKMLDLYSNLSDDSTKGIFVTHNDKYYGFISIKNLLILSHNRNIEIAKNQNPLTKLTGNDKIQEYLKNAFNNLKHTKTYHIVYFDFKDFKPFNDIYGFRLGDRAILLFSDILRKDLNDGEFIGHVGGDDFFIGFEDQEYSNVYNKIYAIQEQFKNEVSSLYNIEDNNNGFIYAKDRFGTERKFSLLSVSAAIIELKKGKRKKIESAFDTSLGKIKKASKLLDTPVGVCLI